MLRDFLYRLSWLRRRPKLEEDLEAELAHHLAMKQRELEREGQTEEDARFAARRSLGSVEGWKDEARDVWRFQWLESLWLDLTYSIRLLSKEKIFTCVALVTLALGIGANTAIFALLNGLLWRPLPVPHPEELVRLSVTNLPPNYQQWVNGKPVKTNERQQVTFAMYEALEKRQQVFSGMFASAGGGDMQLALGGTPHRARVTSITGSFFPVLGIPPQAGRLLNDQDDAPGSVAQWPAVISDELWSKLFARSPSAVGAAISIESTPFTIVGVAPASFHGINPGVETDAWIPLSSLEAIYPTFKWRADRTAWAIQPMARMRPGITAAQAGSYLASIAPAVLEDAKEPKLTGQDEKYFVAMKFRAATASAGESWLADFYGGALWILLGAVGAVLLIAVTNLTNLFTARMASRRHEIALRLSLGASASRIRRQLLMEVAVLAIGGTLAGLIWAQWLIAAFEAAASSGNSAIYLDTTIDWRIFAFLAAILVVVMAIAGLAPAFAASRVEPQDALKKRGGGSASLRFRRGLIVLQTAFSLTLIAGAGLMLASLRGLLGDATGFQSDNSVFLLPDLYNAGVSRQRNAQVDDEIRMRTRELPNVVAAGWILHIPLTGSLSNLSVEVPGRADLNVEQRTVYEHQISDGYFSAAGIPLLAGTDLPSAGSRRMDICLLSDNAARRFFGSARGAVGQHLKIGKNLIEVIGVVADAKYQNVREAAPPTMYVPYWSGSTVPAMALAVRYRGSFDAAYSSMQLLFQKEAGRMPYIQVSTIRGNVAESVSPERLMAWLLGGFAAFALLISVVGLAGLLSYAVEQRRKELGIRLALGATPGRIRRDVQFEGLVLIALGLAAGVVLSFALRRSLNAFLYGVGAADPLIWTLGIGVLLAAGAIAGAIPAARAARVDPSTMLRDE